MRFVEYSFLLLFSLPTYSADVVDDAGNRIHLAIPAKRIVSLAPDITEILFALGQGQHIVGVVSGSDFPAEALKRPIVGSYLGLDLERLLALSPDLIVTWGNSFGRQLKVIKQLGVPVYTTLPKQLEDVPRTMLNLGQLTGAETKAKKLADDFKQQLSFLRTTYQQQSPITVFFQLGSYSLLTINKESWINQVISLCGGRNVFANALTAAPAVNWEAIMAANPQAVFNAALDDNWTKSWRKWPQLAAVKHNRLWRIPPDWIERAGPRLMQGAALLCQDLHLARQEVLTIKNRQVS